MGFENGHVRTEGWGLYQTGITDHPGDVVLTVSAFQQFTCGIEIGRDNEVGLLGLRSLKEAFGDRVLMSTRSFAIREF